MSLILRVTDKIAHKENRERQDNSKNKGSADEEEETAKHHLGKKIPFGVTADHLIDYGAHKLLFVMVCLLIAPGLV